MTSGTLNAVSTAAAQFGIVVEPDVAASRRSFGPRPNGAARPITESKQPHARIFDVFALRVFVSI